MASSSSAAADLAAPLRSTANRIPCCLCGTMIYANAANQCGACLAQQFDLKSALQRGPGGAHDITVYQCRKCKRYERPSDSSSTSAGGTGRYDYFEPESPELLSLCLKHIPALRPGRGGEQKAQMAGIGSISVADAIWVWTEPHSMRFKVRLTVRAEVGGSGGGASGGSSSGGGGGVTIQQRCLVELRVAFRQCPECNREYTNRTWQAVVQLRQKRTDGAPRRGLVLLEAAIAKNAEVRRRVIRIETTRHGFDFYFLSLMHAKTFASYLGRICPMRAKTTQKLVSSDVKSNTANVKHTVSCDLVPLCRDDLIIVDRAASHSGGGAGRLTGRLCLVERVTSAMRLVDANPARKDTAEGAFAELNSDRYWKGGEERSYRIVFSPRMLVRFVVLDVELCGGDGGGGGGSGGGESDLYRGPQSGVDKYALADVEVAREADFGVSDVTYRCVTHLGNLLRAGDVVLGYDMVNSVLPGDAEWSLENSLNSTCVVPDVVLVKKAKEGKGGDNDGGAEELTPQEGSGDDKEGRKGSKTKSKRRERRRKREEKKARALEEAAARMGFLEDEGEEGGTGLDLDRERSAFEKELEDDPELRRELEEAERELAEAKEEEEEEEDDGQGERTSEGEVAGPDGEGSDSHQSQQTPQCGDR